MNDQHPNKRHSAVQLSTTSSRFIAMLAFTDDKLQDAAKFGVLFGSLISVTFGLGWGAEYVQRHRNIN